MNDMNLFTRADCRTSACVSCRQFFRCRRLRWLARIFYAQDLAGALASSTPPAPRSRTMLLTMTALLDDFCRHKQRSSVWCYKKAGYRTRQPARDGGGCEGPRAHFASLSKIAKIEDAIKWRFFMTLVLLHGPGRYKCTKVFFCFTMLTC